jgi:nicotinamidase-related amidase
MDQTKLFLFVDVDTQRDLVEPEGALAVPGAEAAMANVRRLIAFAAERGVPIFSTVDAHQPDDAEFKASPPHSLAGTRGAEKVEGTLLADAVRVPFEKSPVPNPLPRQLVLEKRSHDLLRNPNALSVLAQIYGRTAVVFGFALEGAVKQTVIGLRRHGFPCRVVRDATASLKTEIWPEAEREIIETGAVLMSADEVKSLVEKRLETLSGHGA